MIIQLFLASLSPVRNVTITFTLFKEGQQEAFMYRMASNVYHVHEGQTACVPAIKSKTNYWGYHVSLNPPKLAFTICPFGYCKSPATNSTEYNACQGKRTGVMCGMCSQSYTEALWSTYCTPVRDCNDHWFWIFFLGQTFSMAIILVFKPPFVTHVFKPPFVQIFWFRTLSSRTADTQTNRVIIPSSCNEETPQENNISSSSTQLNTTLLRTLFSTFYQIAQLLLSSSSLKEFFDTQFRKPVLGFFNFQPSFTKQGFICPFSGLTPETKLFFKIAPVFGTLFSIFFYYALYFFICRIRRAIRPAIAPYLQASVKTVFLGYVTLATVSMSLIRSLLLMKVDGFTMEISHVTNGGNMRHSLLSVSL